MRKALIMRFKFLYAVPAVSMIFLAALEFDKMFDIPVASDGDLISKESLEWERQRYMDPATGQIPFNIYKRSLEYAKSLPGSYNHLLKTGARMQSTEWNRRGPYYWGGRTRGFAMDIRDENILIGGGVTGGVYRSTDGGLTWLKTTLQSETHSVSCLVQDTRPGYEDNWYYGTGEFRGSPPFFRGFGIFKSTNNGISWFPLADTRKNRVGIFDEAFDFTNEIVIDPTVEGPGTILAATTIGGIYRSADGGETWNPVMGGFGNGYPYYTDISVTSDGVFYAALSQASFQPQNTVVQGIYRSENGIDWVEITPDGWPAEYNRVEIAIAPSDESQVYFVGDTPNHGKWTTNSLDYDLWHSLWKYTYLSGDGRDEGGIWEDRSESIPRPEIVRQHMNSQSSYNLVIAVKPDDPDFVVIGATNLFRSTNGFKDTTTTTIIGGTCPGPDNTCDYHYRYPNHHADLHRIFFHKNNSDIMFTGSDGGMHKTLDVNTGETEWISLNNGYFTTQFYTCAIDHGDNRSRKIVGGLQDNGTLFHNAPDLMLPWVDVNRADGFYCQIPDNSDGTLYVSQNSSRQPKIKIYKIKVDKNGKKIDTARIDPIGGYEFIWNTPFILDPNDNRRMYLAGGQIIWRNNNLDEIPFGNGRDSISTNWDSLQYSRVEGIHPSQGFPEEITALGVSKNPEGRLYYGTNLGNLYMLDNASSGQPVKVEITPQIFTPNATIGCIAIDPEDANNILVSFTNFAVQSIFLTTDGGETWESVSGNLEEIQSGSGDGPAVNWIEIVKVNGRNLYFAGTSTGLYSTAFLNGMNTVWEQEGAESIGNAWVDMMDVRQLDGYMAVATHGTGMYDGFVTTLPVVPGKPGLVAPTNQSINIPPKQVFEWAETQKAFLYTLEIATDADFTDIVKTYSNIDGTSLEASGLESGYIDMFWRVKAQNAGGYSEYSDVWRFRTMIGSPELVYPENGDENVWRNVTLEWEAEPGAQKYHLQLSENSLFTKLTVDWANLTDTKFKVPPLPENKRFYWRVSAIDDFAESDFSTTRRFTTGTETSVRILDAKLLGGPYPNPAHEHVSLKYFFEAERISIRLYDIRGIIVKSHADRNVTYGEYIHIDVSELSPGTYFSVIDLPQGRLTRTIRIIR